MKLIKVKNLVPGMMLAQDVLIPGTGVILLSENTALTVEMIRRITSFNIEEVLITEGQKSSEEKDEEILVPIMVKSHQRAIEVVEDIITNYGEYAHEEQVIRGVVGELLEQVELNSSLLLNLTHLKNFDNYLFSHSVNVTILALMIGEALEYSKDELNLLGEAALLHDIGMLKIPVNTWDKSGPLTSSEYNEVKNHPLYGEKFLENMPKDVQKVAGEHHERYDGSGYPKGLKGSDINFKARIIAIADVYDACISQRSYRDKLTLWEALEMIMLDQEKYDPDLLKAFVSVMAIYPIGSMVELNTGEIGKVIKVTKNRPFRPVIQIYFDREKRLLEETIRVNLGDKSNHVLYIKQTLPADRHREILEQLEGT